MRIWWVMLSLFLVWNPGFVWAQNNPNETDEGPWSDVAGTTLTVPKVANGRIAIDGTLSAGEWSAFGAGVNVVPYESAWVLNFAEVANYENANDTSFRFWLAHDEDNLYVGVQAKDDTVISDNDNAQFWRDDAIEIIVDPLDQNYDINTDMFDHPVNDYGGHHYVNYEGRFSRWDEANSQKLNGWSNQVEWTWGDSAADEIQGRGVTTADGWTLEVRYAKSLFENPEAGNQLDNGYKMGFNIGMDDDDGENLAIQYWWANNLRPIGWTPEQAENYTAEEIRNQTYYNDFPLMLDANGRLTQGGTGHIIFAPGFQCDLNNDGAADAADAAIMFGNWGRTGAGDCNADNAIDAADAGILFGEWTGDPTADPGTAAAEYNIGTGEIKVAINGVVNWYIESASAGLTGAPLGDLPGSGLQTDSNARVGETALASFGYNVSLGNVATSGLPQGDLVIYWNSALGQPLRNAPVQYIPEPAGIIWLALLGAAGLRRRLAA